MPVYIKIKKTTLLIILFLIVFLLIGFILGFLASRRQGRQLSEDKALVQTPKEKSQKPAISPYPSPSPRPPSLPAEILGGWTVYQDCPNVTLNFYTKGEVKIHSCDGDYQTLVDEVGSYAFDGSKSIKVSYSGGEDFVLEIVKESGQTYLQIKGYQTRYWKYQ